MKTKVAVVIPNWNGEDYIADCLSSLERQSVKPHIVVVDNGSHDDSVKLIKENFSKIELLEFADNAGFAGGVNRGIRSAMKSGFEYVALFNNDAIADTDWIKNLVGAAKNHPEAGIVTGKFMRIDKKYIDSTGDMYSTWGIPFPRGRNQLDSGQFDTGEYIFGATGGASLYRTAMLKKTGLFDDDFFAYFEDVDISFRAQLQGWKVWYQPDAVAFHHVSATSTKLGSFTRYHQVKNFLLLYIKNMPGLMPWKYLPGFLMGYTRMLGGSIKSGHPWAFVKASFVAVVLLPATLKKRHKIQKSRSVTEDYIDSIVFKGKPQKIPKFRATSS